MKPTLRLLASAFVLATLMARPSGFVNAGTIDDNVASREGMKEAPKADATLAIQVVFGAPTRATKANVNVSSLGFRETDDRGYVVYPGVAPGKYTYTVDATCHKTKTGSVKVVAGKTNVITVDLASACSSGDPDVSE